MREYELQFPQFVINYYPERWSNYFDGISESEFWVATTLEDRVIGHAGHIFNSELSMYEIVGVVVSKEYKRKGVGRELLKIVCSQIQKKNQNKVVLFTLGHPGNEATMDFYDSIGYIKTNYEEDFFREGYSRVTYMKEFK